MHFNESGFIILECFILEFVTEHRKKWEEEKPFGFITAKMIFN